MATPKITLYVDVVSPFAYIAYYVLRNHHPFTTLPITYVPVFLGGIMSATNNRPPIQIKNKDKWINTERIRWAELFGLPIAATAPDNFPVNTIAIQRALVHIQKHHPQSYHRALDVLFDAVWGPPRNTGFATDAKTGLPKYLAQVLAEQGTKDVLAGIGTDEVKKQLTTNTSEAVEAGAFGLPYFVATNKEGKTETFWGVDHLGQVVDFLGLERGKLGRAGRAML